MENTADDILAREGYNPPKPKAPALKGPGSTWQYRAVQATRGNQSQLGAILIDVLHKSGNRKPRFVGPANITSDGFVMCSFVSRDGVFYMGALVAPVSDLVRNFRGLADHLKLNDAERIEMFAEVRKWIGRDYRRNTALFD